jgi:plasmid stabilization system protein ParE
MGLKLVILRSAVQDLRWFNIYYEERFPEGMANAATQFEKCTKLLCELPGMGIPAGAHPRRRFSIPKTPFTLIYRPNEDRLEIVRVLDQRKEDYLKELFEDDHSH